MATAFPVETYPLVQGFDVPDHSKVIRDTLDDGTPHLRVIGTVNYRTVPLQFAPLDAATSSTLVEYLNSNDTTEFDLDFQGGTLTGYLWSDPSTRYEEGQYWVSVDFYAKRSA